MKKNLINDMSVKKKISVFSLSMLLFIVILTICGLFTATNINKELRNRYDHYGMGQYYLSESTASFCNVMVYTRNAILAYYDNPEKLNAQKTYIATYTEATYDHLKEFENLLGYLSPQIRTQYQKVVEKIDALIDNTNKNIALCESGKQPEAVADMMENGKKCSEEAGMALNDLVVMMQTASDENSETVETRLILMTVVLVVVSVIAFLLTMVYSALLTRNITVPMAKLSEAAKKLALGDIDVDCQKINNDDLGELMDDFAVMVKTIKTQASIANDIAKGDLTIRVETHSDKDVLGKSFQRLITDNNRILGNIKEATGQVTVGAEQVASASQSLAQGSTEQASALQQVTASMDEIAERTKANAAQANEANEFVNDIKSTAIEGNGQMKAMIGAMNDINESSETISKIIKTIDNIAFQTNILALNASVEAARAGVHGKGFAVVAEEVRSLAAKSASAANETQNIVEDTIRKIGNGSKIAEDTAKSLGVIVDSIDRIVGLVGNIAIASNDQATAVSQIDQAISQVSQVVQTNSATSEQCAAASEELSNQAATLRSLLGNYKLTTGGQGGSSFGGSSRSYDSDDNYNEQIISLDGEFGKY